MIAKIRQTINQIALDAWLSEAKTVTGYSKKRIYDYHKREDVVQEALIRFAGFYQGYLVAPEGQHNFDFSKSHTATLAISCIEDAARVLGCRAIKINEDKENELQVQFVDLDKIAEMPAPTSFYQSPAERAQADKVNMIIEFALNQNDKRFANICALLMQGCDQREIAKRLSLAPSTINELIARNRDVLIEMMQVQRGLKSGC